MPLLKELGTEIKQRRPGRPAKLYALRKDVLSRGLQKILK